MGQGQRVKRAWTTDPDDYDSGWRACQLALHAFLSLERDLSKEDGRKAALRDAIEAVADFSPYGCDTDAARIEEALVDFASLHGTPNSVAPSELSTFHADIGPMRIGRAAKIVRSIFVEGRVVPVAYRDRRFILGE